MKTLLIGTSGYHYKDWRERFYPRELKTDQWLAYFAREFRTVEINNSFYRLPKVADFERWRDQTPPGFRFAVKASRFITHIRKLNTVEESLEKFFERADALGAKLGPVLYQFPPTLQRDVEVLQAFLTALPRRYTHVVEFRHKSWYEEAVFELLDQHGIGHCIHDKAGVKSPVRFTGGVGYIRFHGPNGKYGGSYSDAALERWARMIDEARSDLKATYVYFNNDTEGHALNNARTLIKQLSPGEARQAA